MGDNNFIQEVPPNIQNLKRKADNRTSWRYRLENKRYNQKKANQKIRKDDYEFFQQGPISIERIGRYVQMSSNWKPDDFKKHIQFIQEKRIKVHAGINRKISEILNLIGQYDPIELLTTVSIKNCFTDPEQYSESTYEGKEAYMEYAQSLIMGNYKLGIGNHTNEKVIDKFNKLIQDILKDVMWFFGSEATKRNRDQQEDELRFTSILRYLFVRGDSWLQVRGAVPEYKHYPRPK